jgi:uncharacterized protein YkuJ
MKKYWEMAVIAKVKFSCQNPSTKRGKTPSNVTLTLRIWHHLERVVISNIIWKFDEEILRNGKVIANVKFSCQNPSTKRGITPSNVILTLRIWHLLDRVVISNIVLILKFDEEILWNGKVIANVKFLWWMDWEMDRRMDKVIPMYRSDTKNW